MVQKVRVELLCDVCGEPARRTLHFSFDDEQEAHHNYELEVCWDHAKQFDVDLQPWVEKARRAAKPQRTRPASPAGSSRRDPAELDAIRQWARANGHKVNDKGRIPAEVEAAFRKREAIKLA